MKSVQIRPRAEMKQVRQRKKCSFIKCRLNMISGIESLYVYIAFVKPPEYQKVNRQAGSISRN